MIVALTYISTAQVLGISEDNEPTHWMNGMSYDQLGQMLATVVDGRLYKEGTDFKVFKFSDDDIHSIEDGIMVDKAWLLSNPENEETLVRFLKGLHKGWIFCRDNPDECAKLVAPTGEDPLLQQHQRYQMHEVSPPSSRGTFAIQYPI